MLRRKFIACLAGGVAAGAAWPLAVHAQRPNGVRRIGVLEPIYDPMIRSVILPELAQRGFVDGRNLVVDVRIGNSDEMPKLARELVAPIRRSSSPSPTGPYIRPVMLPN